MLMLLQMCGVNKCVLVTLDPLLPPALADPWLWTLLAMLGYLNHIMLKRVIRYLNQVAQS